VGTFAFEIDIEVLMIDFEHNKFLLSYGEPQNKLSHHLRTLSTFDAFLFLSKQSNPTAMHCMIAPRRNRRRFSQVNPLLQVP
jgi:hypothetical protein